MIATLNILFFTIALSVAASGHAEEGVQPKNDDSQKDVMEQWKEMRQESGLTEDAGKRNLFSELGELTANKSGEAAPKKVKKIATEKAKKAVTEKVGETATNKVKEIVAEKSDTSPKTKKTKGAKKKEKPGDAGKSKSPDGTTKTPY